MPVTQPQQMFSNQLNNNPLAGMPSSIPLTPNNLYFNQPRNWNQPVMTSAPQNQGFPGRMINNPADVRPNEVPMDGSVSLFPMADGSCIYAKAWGSDGNIQTARFVPDISSQQQAPSELSQVMARLDAIERRLTELFVEPTPKPAAKKSVEKGAN